MQDKLVIHVQKEQTGLPPHKIISMVLDFAAEILRLHWQTVREMCLRGEIKAPKAGRKWVLTTKAIADYLDNVNEPEDIVQVQLQKGKHRKNKEEVSNVGRKTKSIRREK